jgi:hypothetical protein
MTRLGGNKGDRFWAVVGHQYHPVVLVSERNKSNWNLQGVSNEVRMRTALPSPPIVSSDAQPSNQPYVGSTDVIALSFG